ncbi:MAG: fatty acid desaturase [Gemmatimonadota bacterium]
MTGAWRPALARYQGGDWRIGARQIATTGALFVLAWYAAYRSLAISYWLTLALALPTAGVLVRLFTIQHDCGHGSFLPSPTWNDWIGRALGVVTLTPYRYWRRFHALHHATSGKLERRGFYDIITLTVREYRALPWWKRLAYRVYRDPVFLFAIAPTVLFVVLHRFPFLAPRSWRAERRSILGTDVALAAVIGLLAATIGLRAVLLIQAPVTVIASGVGMWLFYVQHQFEDAYWEPAGRWDFTHASLVGSSYYALPAWLHWFTGHIGLHHIHHLNTRIPNYRLQACFNENPDLPPAARLTLRDSFHCVRLKLWDEERRKLVPIPNA